MKVFFLVSYQDKHCLLYFIVYWISFLGTPKVIYVLNNHGYCISYHMDEMIKTEMATARTENSQVISDAYNKQGCQ